MKRFVSCPGDESKAYEKSILDIFFGGLISCNSDPRSFEEGLQRLHNDAAKKNKEIDEEQNKEYSEDRKWDHLVDSLTVLAQSNSRLALIGLEAMMSKSRLDQVVELRLIKGNIYCDIDSFRQAIDEYTWAAEHSWSKSLAARAGAYMKIRVFDSARMDLQRAVKIDSAYLWNFGNYFEVMGKRDSALVCYEQFYAHDTTALYCKERIKQLDNPRTTPYKELIYKDRAKMKRSYFVVHYN